LQITPVNVAAVQAVPGKLRATASGVLLTTGMVGATLGIAVFGAVFGDIARSELTDRLGAEGVTVSAGEVEKLDAVVTGSESGQEVLGDFGEAKAARIETAVDESFVDALGDVLKGLAALQLVAAAFALALPRGRQPEVTE
jgi:hypothetical protein